MPRLPRSFSRYPQVNCASGRTQSFGSSVAHPGTRRVSDGSCPPVAESSRTFGQPCGSVPNCRLLMRPLQLHFLRFFTPLLDSQSKLIPMSPEIKGLCAAWASPVRLLEGKPFSPPPHSLVLTSDASQSGWGATSSASPSLRHVVPGGFLGPHQFSRTQGSIPGLEVSRSLVAGQSLLIRSDNTTVVSYINFQGGTHSPSLCLLAIELWEWCILRGIYLLAAHIPGERQPGGGLPVQREVPSIGVDSQSFDFSSDLSGDLSLSRR